MTSAAREPLLVGRAREFLAAGPREAAALISHICQLPAAPAAVAEHLARTLLGSSGEFEVDEHGRWRLAVAGRVGVAGVTSQRAIDGRFVVVDVETTGSSATGGDRVTEIAAVVVEGGELREVYSTLINPQRPIPPWITGITNITWEMVKDAPVFADVCDRVISLLEGRVFVAHNAPFDWSFVGAEVALASGRQLTGERLCTVRLARRLLPQLPRRSLDAVALHYGVEIEARHRAAGDAVATAHVLLRLLRDAADRGHESWEQLDALLDTRTVSGRRRRRSAFPRSAQGEGA